MLTKSKQFAKNIKALLKEQGLNLKQAAQQWGFKGDTHEALLRSWATRGIDHASDKTKPLLKKLAKAFNRNVEDLWKPYPDINPVAKIMEKLIRDLAQLTAKQKREVKKEIGLHFNLVEPSRKVARITSSAEKMSIPFGDAPYKRTGNVEDATEMYFRTNPDVDYEDQAYA
jgi:hypothetical protein